MGVITLLGSIVYRKRDITTTISFSLLIILVYNPFLIKSASVLLSYTGTIGIIVFSKNIFKVLKLVRIKNKKFKYRINKNIIKLDLKVKEVLSVTISAQILIMPIMIRLYNTVSLSVIITSLFLTLVIGLIIVLGFLQIIVSFISINLGYILSVITSFFLEILIQIAKLGDVLPLSKIYVTTPKIVSIIVYYIIVFIINYIYKLKISNNKNAFQTRILNLYYLFKYFINKNKLKVCKIIVFFFILIIVFLIIPKDLRIYFIDVNQGDSTLIKTPKNKIILVDGGGSINYDVGKNTLIPYLLDRKVKKVDYIIVSHFDEDHIRAV